MKIFIYVFIKNISIYLAYFTCVKLNLIDTVFMKDRFGNPLVNAELAIQFLLIIIFIILEIIIQFLIKNPLSNFLNKSKTELFLKGFILNISCILYLLTFGNARHSIESFLLFSYIFILSAFIYQNLFKKTITQK
jgi:hypothetical protein